MPNARIGIFTAALRNTERGPQQANDVLDLIADAGIDHLCVGDHVSFVNGAGNDALISASALLAAQAQLPVYVALYLLPLRHPVPVARQLATIAERAPGRLTLGVGIGGEDRHEIEVCGVDPSTRGRRMDEYLRVLRGLSEGTPVTFNGDFVTIENAQIAPAQSPRIPLIVGGRSDAAVRRAATLGDGWLGIWISPRRYADVCDQIASHAAEVGRDGIAFAHSLNVWCGFAATRESARDLVATQMQAFYQMPFGSFERYSPYGHPEDVAEFLSPYLEAGCSTLNIIPCARSDEEAIAAVAEVRALLTGNQHAAEPPRSLVTSAQL